VSAIGLFQHGNAMFYQCTYLLPGHQAVHACTYNTYMTCACMCTDIQTE